MAGSGYYALRFTVGRFKGGEFPLRPNREFTIGRGSEYDMVLDEDMVSRRHAKLATLHGQIVLQDLKSTNGTFVNGERISLVRLKLGDKILIGTSIMEVVEADRSQPGGTVTTREVPSIPLAMGPPSNPSSGPAVRTADLARTEAAMPVLRFSTLPGAPSIESQAPVIPPSSPNPRAEMTSQPPGSLVPMPPPPEPPLTQDLAQGMSGHFPDDDIGLTDLIEVFTANKRTGILIVTTPEGAEARLAIREGRLYHGAIHPGPGQPPLPIDGTKAVFRVLTWPTGDFRLDTKASLPQPEIEIQLGTREIVIEALRQWDELRKYEAHLLGPERGLALARPLKARLSALSAEALDTLQLVVNHGRIGPVLDHSAASDLETWQDLLYLLQNGYLAVE